MAYEAGTAFLSVVPSFRGGARQIADEFSQPMSQAGQQAGQQFGRGTETGFVAGSRGLMTKVAGIAAAIGLQQVASEVVGYFNEAVGAASNLNETVNRSNEIFGENSSAIQDWAAQAATAAGLSKAAALDAASGFGNMFSQLGFSATETANLSTSVVQLSADLGSFNNLPTEDVAQRISAAFRGEYDSLQMLIPNINAARVEQEALAATGKTLARELTAQEKATAVLAIVQKDGAAALGDYERTSDSLANTQKTLNAEMENLKTEIGEALLPVVTDLMRTFLEDGVPALKELATWFTNNQDSIRQFILISADMGLLFLQSVLAMMRIWSMFGQAFFTVTDEVVRFFFAAADSLLAAAERAFGWIPGIGERLKETRRGFDETRTNAERNLGALRSAADKVTEGLREGEKAVGDLRTAVKNIPATASTTVSLPGVAEAIRDAKTLRDIMAMTPEYKSITFASSVKGAVPSPRAHGGPVVAGRPYLVGERGPELVVPKTSGTVIPNHQLGGATAGGGPLELGQRTIEAIGAVVKDGAVYTVRDYDRGRHLAGRAAW